MVLTHLLAGSTTAINRLSLPTNQPPITIPGPTSRGDMATQKPWMVHYLKETAVTFFGILTVISLVLWTILIVVAIT